MNYTEIIGLIAAFLTTAAFVPQAYKTYRTKDVSGLSLPMFSMFTLGIVLWFTYGFLKDSLPIILANAVTGVLSIMLLVFKIRYGKRE
jgi:MtN3 and saliva related transmembrane protein